MKQPEYNENGECYIVQRVSFWVDEYNGIDRERVDFHVVDHFKHLTPAQCLLETLVNSRYDEGYPIAHFYRIVVRRKGEPFND